MKTSIIPAAGLAAACVGLLLASGTPAQNAPASGQDLYKEYCKQCHAAGAAAGEYTPMTLIQDQWTRFFEKKYQRTHEGVLDGKHGGKAVTEVITPEMLESIRKFAVDHAADSESPMNCG